MKSASPPGRRAGIVLASLLGLLWPVVLSAGLAPVPSSSQPREEELGGGVLRDQIEADWLKQAKAIAPREYPTARFIERGRRLAAELRRAGVDCAPSLRKLDDVSQRLQALPKGTSDGLRRALYLEARWVVRGLVFANPALDFDRLLFVKRFTQETYPDVCLNHMPWCSRPGGDLCILSAAGGQKLSSALAAPGASSPQLRYLLNRALGPGHVHGMDLWWDGSRVVFGYARTPTDEPPEGWLDRARSYHFRRTVEPTHIFEIGIDGRNLRQLTSGEWSDLDPTYTPGGDIVFVSERCGTSLQCNEYDKDETSCNLYVMKPDGSGIRRLSANKDGDYLPHTFDDGTVGYLRWEYHERSWAFIQSIWTIRPDGTCADAVFKQHFTNPWSLEDMRVRSPAARSLSASPPGTTRWPPARWWWWTRPSASTSRRHLDHHA